MSACKEASFKLRLQMKGDGHEYPLLQFTPAGAITAVMCGQAYLTSSRIAEAVGPFPGYPVNEQPFLEIEVIRMHRDSVNRINRNHIPVALYQGAQQCWDDAYQSGRQNGIEMRK